MQKQLKLFSTVGAALLICVSAPISFASPGKERLNQRFITAIQHGDIAGAKKALAEGANVNAKDSDGEPALFIPTQPPSNGGGDEDLVKLLLSHGANVKARDAGGGTALMSAAASGWTEIVKLLLSKGADVNAQDKDRQTALMRAANGVETEIGTDLSSPEVMRLLLAKGANSNAVDNSGQTALILAAKTDGGREEGEEEATECVRLLLRAGARVNSRTRSGYTALKWARIRHHIVIVRLLQAAQRSKAAPRLMPPATGRVGFHSTR